MLSREIQDKLKRIIGEEAFANFMNNVRYADISENKDIIITAFTWSNTSQGHAYWSALDDKVREKWYEEDESDLEIALKPKEEVKTLPNINISRRDYFAAMALQGCLSASKKFCHSIIKDITNYSIDCADALIEELDKNNE